MKILQAFLLACSISITAGAQLIALDPAGNGGFESGTTFAANGWTTVGAGSNYWLLSNTAPAHSGLRGAHITNSSAYTYVASTAHTSHLYYDVVMPAGSVGINLSFAWKGQGQAGLDRLLVYTAPTSVTPAANVPVSPATTLGAATLVWTQTTLSSTYGVASISLPSSLSGSTFRLIFTWQNDAAGGIAPPAAIDSVAVTYNCAMPDPIGGSTSVCEGSTTALSNASPGGTWTSGHPLIATVSATGLVSGVSAGTAAISYTTTCASPAVVVVTVFAPPAAIVGPTNVCLGSSISLTNSSVGGVWSSSSTTTVSVVPGGTATGISLGTAIISYANCGIAATTVITVRPIPPAITGPDTVCEGGATVTLSNTMTGGTWSASPTTIATAATSGAGTGLITGISDGTATVTYFSAFGCRATKIMTVEPLPPPITGLAPMCVMNTIILSNSLPGGIWSSAVPGIASVGSTGAVTGVFGGTTLISYTNGCGSATVMVTVDPEPLPIIGDDSVCVGSTTTFANIILGGTWSSSYTAIATILPGSGLITGVSYGLSIITYTMPGGCDITRIVYVDTLAGSITGGLQVCPSGTTLLSHTTPGGTWLSLNPGAATINAATGLVTGIMADTARIVYTNSVGCKAYETVTVNPIPSPIIGDTFYCATDIDTLYNPDAGGAWSSSTPTIASIGNATGVLTTLAEGVATIRYTLPTSCFITRSFTVYPLPAPVVGFHGPTNTLSTGTGYETYQWYHSIHGKVVGATIFKTAGIYNGSYYVVVTDTNGCEAASAPFAYNVSMGIGATAEQKEIHVFPNPAMDVVNIVAGENVKAVISSVEGKTVIEQDNVSTVNIAKLPHGVYVLSLYSKDGLKIAVEKLIKL